MSVQRKDESEWKSHMCAWLRFSWQILIIHFKAPFFPRFKCHQKGKIFVSWLNHIMLFKVKTKTADSERRVGQSHHKSLTALQKFLIDHKNVFFMWDFSDCLKEKIISLKVVSRVRSQTAGKSCFVESYGNKIGWIQWIIFYNFHSFPILLNA